MHTRPYTYINTYMFLTLLICVPCGPMGWAIACEPRLKYGSEHSI